MRGVYTNRRGGSGAKRRGRLRRYRPEVGEALVKAWEAGDRMCSKLVVAVIPDLVDAVERHGELQLAPELRSQLVEISAASINLRIVAQAGTPHGRDQLPDLRWPGASPRPAARTP